MLSRITQFTQQSLRQYSSPLLSSSLFLHSSFSSESIKQTNQEKESSTSWLPQTNYKINENYTKSNAFGEKKNENGFGKVLTRPRQSSLLTSPHVFITNLRRGTSYQLVRKHMSAVGEVKYARVFTKEEKGYSTAMVEYFTMEAAERAMKEMHGSELEGNSLWVREFRDGERITTTSSKNVNQ